MTAPGWYHGDGDPVGSLRYWDGTQWQGDAAFPPAAANSTAVTPAPMSGSAEDFYGVLAEPSTQSAPQNLRVLKPERPPIQRKRHGHFPLLLKIVAITVALFYAVPLAIGLWFAFNPSGRQVVGGIDLTSLNPAGWLGLLIAIWIPTSLVVMILGALWEKPGMVMAGGAYWIMVGGGLTWLAWEWHFVSSRGGTVSGIPLFAYFYTALLITQVGVMLWASRI